MQRALMSKSMPNETVIAEDFQELWKSVLEYEAQDVPGITIDVCVLRNLIERASSVAALRARCERLASPVSDEEWATTKTWPKGLWRDHLDALLVDRLKGE